VVVFAVLAALVAPAAAGDEAQPAVGLDKLLKIPPTVRFEPTTRGHSTKFEWRERFDEAHAELEKARAELTATQAKLAEKGASSSAWSMGAPGIGNVDRAVANEAPLDQTLSRTLRKNREGVERAERRLTELEVEANLAQVPDDWRGSPQPEADEPQALR
jgi:hypothetical protein